MNCEPLGMTFRRTEPEYDMWGNRRRQGTVAFGDGVVYKDAELEELNRSPRVSAADWRKIHKIKKLIDGEILSCPKRTVPDAKTRQSF